MINLRDKHDIKLKITKYSRFVKTLAPSFFNALQTFMGRALNSIASILAVEFIYVVLSFSTFFLMLSLFIYWRTNYDLRLFMVDPTQTGGLPPYAGLVSNAGVVVWVTGAAVGLFSAAAINAVRGASADARMLLCFGGFTGLMALDDLFLIHENFMFGEKILLLAYVACLGGVLIYNVQALLRSPYLVLCAALLLFAASVAVDTGQGLIERHIGELRILLEDGLKFFAIALWTGFIWNAGVGALRNAARARACDQAISDG